MSLPAEDEKLQDISWVRCHLRGNNDTKGDEIPINWISESRIGFRGITEGEFPVVFEIAIAGATPSTWALKAQVSAMGADEDGGVFHVNNASGAVFDLGYLLRLARIENQSDELSVKQILLNHGLTEWTGKASKKKRNYKLIRNTLSLVFCLLVCAFIFFSSWIMEKSDGGTVASSVQTEVVVAKNGATISDILPEGTQVRKGQVLARMVDPQRLGSLTDLQDQVAEARKQKKSLQDQIESLKIAYQEQLKITKNSKSQLASRKDLVKEGFVSGASALQLEDSVSKSQLSAELIMKDITKFREEVKLIDERWGPNFSKVNAQIAELNKQIHSLAITAKCDCLLYSVDHGAEFTTFQLVDTAKPFFLEVALHREKAANLINGQTVWFKLPNEYIYKTGKYVQVNTNIKTRIGAGNDTFNNSKLSVIRVIPDEPIAGEPGIIGRPVSVVLLNKMYPGEAIMKTLLGML